MQFSLSMVWRWPYLSSSLHRRREWSRSNTCFTFCCSWEVESTILLSLDDNRNSRSKDKRTGVSSKLKFVKLLLLQLSTAGSVSCRFCYICSALSFWLWGVLAEKLIECFKVLVDRWSAIIFLVTEIAVWKHNLLTCWLDIIIFISLIIVLLLGTYNVWMRWATTFLLGLSSPCMYIFCKSSFCCWAPPAGTYSQLSCFCWVAVCIHFHIRIMPIFQTWSGWSKLSKSIAVSFPMKPREARRVFPRAIENLCWFSVSAHWIRNVCILTGACRRSNLFPAFVGLKP